MGVLLQCIRRIHPPFVYVSDNFLFKEILELVDFDLSNSNAPESCPQFHFMPRFVRELPEKGRELLPMCEVLKYFLESNKKLIEEDALSEIHKMSASEWQNLADSVKGILFFFFECYAGQRTVTRMDSTALPVCQRTSFAAAIWEFDSGLLFVK